MERHNLLEAPCVFCGYNGPRYWQAGTHAEDCPWRVIGGIARREQKLRGVIEDLDKTVKAFSKEMRPLSTLTDLDLPPINRTEANLWKAKYFEARAELVKANKGIRRLRRTVEHHHRQAVCDALNRLFWKVPCYRMGESDKEAALWCAELADAGIIVYWDWGKQRFCTTDKGVTGE